MQEKASFDKSTFVLDPKFYPKRSKLDLELIRREIESNGLANSSIQELASRHNVSYSLMYDVVTNTLGMKYRRISPISIKSIAQSSMNGMLLFMMRQYFLMTDNCSFIYMDESSFSNHKRSNYRWMSRCRKRMMYDYGRIKRVNLIMAVCNSGIVHYKLNRRNNKATNVEKFIRQLITELK